MAHDCLICFCQVDSTSIVQCGNPECTACVCAECATALVMFSYSENTMPRCPNTQCRQPYLYSQIKQHIGADGQHAYVESCFRHVENDKGEQASSIAAQDLMIEKLRKDRLEFIQSRFPAAISLTIQYALGSKMRRIDRENRVKMKRIIESSHRNCFNLLCPGKLTPEYVCVTCNTSFCKRCERKTTPDHVCDDKDIESVQFVQSLVKCPKCKYPVIKSIGCNYMTCSVCQTNFNYETGEVTKYGNHHNATTHVNTSVKPSQRFADKCDAATIDVLRRFESAVPKPDLGTVVRLLTKLKKQENDHDHIKMQIAQQYERYVTHMYAQKQYYKIMQEIENHYMQTSTMNFSTIAQLTGLM